jgi:hypothetical protein
MLRLEDVDKVLSRWVDRGDGTELDRATGLAASGRLRLDASGNLHVGPPLPRGRQAAPRPQDRVSGVQALVRKLGLFAPDSAYHQRMVLKSQLTPTVYATSTSLGHLEHIQLKRSGNDYPDMAVSVSLFMRKDSSTPARQIDLPSIPIARLRAGAVSGTTAGVRWTVDVDGAPIPNAFEGWLWFQLDGQKIEINLQRLKGGAHFAPWDSAKQRWA